MRLIIVRHGETDWTLSGRYTGTTDVGLTANGHREAAELAPLLEQVLYGQSCAVSSPRRRATDTAALALPQSLFASAPAAVSVIEDHQGERCIRLWNVGPALLVHPGDLRTVPPTMLPTAQRL